MNNRFLTSKRGILILCLVIVNAISVGIVLAYVLSGQDWTYQENPMGEDYVVNENCGDCTGEADAVNDAATTWNNSCAAFSFTYGGTSTCNATAYDGVNCIFWGTQANNILATATWWYNPTNGNILEADCEFNDNYTWSTADVTPSEQMDVETVMLHEFGHWLSLGHSTPPAVMQPTVGSGTQRRELTQDDKDGIQKIYGSKGCSTLGFSNSVVVPAPGQAIINMVLMFSAVIMVPLIRIFRKRKI